MKKINLKNKVVLITGFTGSLGSHLVKRLLKTKVKRIIGFSRDEFKQSEMARKITDRRLEYWLGDVRDLSRLKEACEDVDIIFHFAALKRMDQASHNTFEVANTNIKGTKNVMLAGEECEKVIFVSTDKSYHPENVYGASKFIAERIVLAYSNGICWRFGNFIGSRGSVFEIFKEQRDVGVPLTITDPNATRFVIDIEDVCDYILLDVKPGLYCPSNLKSMTIGKIAESIAPNSKWEIIGIREGEKIDEAFDENYSSKK